ncbi:hypothetical protein NMY22_g20010 [Coprinellus aureogranulatus]|nr:hypothetical protein NMY22_g20010 [Coprinellus aureogranulatus]
MIRNKGEGRKYVKFKQLQGAGFNNQAQEILLFHHLALQTHRTYVYQPFIWRPRGENAEVPLSAFLRGVTRGSISSSAFDEVCPESEVKHVRIRGVSYEGQWKYAKEVLGGEERCVVVDDWLFSWNYRKYLETHFEWSPQVLEIVDRTQADLGLQSNRSTKHDHSSYMAVHLRRDKDATDYLRAVVASAEKSPRVLELTEAVVRMNPSHYTAWQYRYETILSLLPSPPPANDPLLERELELMDELAIKHLKSYQVWHHRRLLILLSVSGARKDGKDNEGKQGGKLTTQDVERVKRELAFISRSFEEDAKNYHTWSYRQWVLSHFFGSASFASGLGLSGDTEDQDPQDDVWQTELEWTETMLAKDIRNNSAWHHRFFVVFQRPGVVVTGEGDVKREVG